MLLKDFGEGSAKITASAVDGSKKRLVLPLKSVFGIASVSAVRKKCDSCYSDWEKSIIRS